MNGIEASPNVRAIILRTRQQWFGQAGEVRETVARPIRNAGERFGAACDAREADPLQRRWRRERCAA